jgi:transposase-like protein
MSTPAALRWEPIVRRARESGLSMRAYARQHGINERTLTWWNWRLGEELTASEFVEVEVAEPSGPLLRLQLGPVQVDVDDQTDLALLRRVVEALS